MFSAKCSPAEGTIIWLMLGMFIIMALVTTMTYRVVEGIAGYRGTDERQLLVVLAFDALFFTVGIGVILQLWRWRKRLRLAQQRCGNVTERQTSHDMSSDANYNGLYLTIPPPLGFSGPESPPPSYEVAHVFDKPVQTPPPSYSAAVDLSGQPIWDHSYFPSQQHTPHVCDTHAHSSLHVDDTHSHSTSN